MCMAKIFKYYHFKYFVNKVNFVNKGTSNKIFHSYSDVNLKCFLCLYYTPSKTTALDLSLLSDQVFYQKGGYYVDYKLYNLTFK